MIRRAPVHYNEDRSLMVIQPLLQQKFGIQNPAMLGSCLVAQAAFSISACTGISEHTISKHIMHYVSRPQGLKENGFTLEQILRTLQIPLSVRGKNISLKVQPMVYHTLVGLIDDVLLGQPVLMILERNACATIENEAYAYKDGRVLATAIRGVDPELVGQPQFHSLLVIGVDSAGYLIVRDTRHKYCYKGYLKIATEIVKQNFENARFIGLEVQM
jgi:hypothetical protein